jgi:hypothetical protein
MSDTVSGMPYPQEKPLLAGNPKDSAIAANNQAITRQADLIKATSGGSKHTRRRNKYGGAAGEVVVPQPQMQYTPTGAPGQNPNDIITQNAEVSVQGAENAKYDSYARKGGSRKRKRKRKGGNSDWSWGCYSGGKRKRKSKSRTYKRKTHKKRKTKRCK